MYKINVKVVRESVVRAGNSVSIRTIDITRINLQHSIGGCTLNILIAKWLISTIFPVL